MGGRPRPTAPSPRHSLVTVERYQATPVHVWAEKKKRRIKSWAFFSYGFACYYFFVRARLRHETTLILGVNCWTYFFFAGCMCEIVHATRLAQSVVGKLKIGTAFSSSLPSRNSDHIPGDHNK